jgi:glycerol-3-phosphate dehydrogenase subunit B
MLMPMGSMREVSLTLDDVAVFPDKHVAEKALIVNYTGFHDFYGTFLAEALEKNGTTCRIRFVRIPEMEHLRLSPSEMRSVQIARIMDRMWEVVVQEVRVLLKDEDTVILPQVFGLQDTSVPGRIRQGIPAQVIFAGTLPPSVPGLRTQLLLKRRYELLGGTYLAGDEATGAHMHEGAVHSVVTKNLEQHYIEASHFILATGGYFSKGLVANPFQVYEPVFGLDVDFKEDRNEWYNPAFAQDQPYMHFGEVHIRFYAKKTVHRRRLNLRSIRSMTGTRISCSISSNGKRMYTDSRYISGMRSSAASSSKI